MKSVFSFAIASTTVFLAGCDVHHEKLVGPYLLIAIDTPEQMSVSYDLGDGTSIGRIEPIVFSVGWNDRYIEAKQHPEKNRSVTIFITWRFLKIASMPIQPTALLDHLQRQSSCKNKKNLDCLFSHEPSKALNNFLSLG